MYKIIYLPDPEIPVYHISRNTFSKEILDRYVIAKTYHFFMTTTGIHSGILSDKRLKAVRSSIIPKHLFEIMEFPDV